MLINITDLPAELQKHVESLRGFVRQALSDYVMLHATLRHRYTARTQASIIHDYMVWFAKESGRYEWRLRRNLFLFRVDKDYSVKPKKIEKRLDGQLGVSNIQTRLVLDFETQRPLCLFDDLDLTHLYLGYLLDPVEVSNSTVWLICPQGKGMKWAVNLSVDEGASALDVARVDTPSPVVPPARRIGRKIAATDKKDKAKGE